MALLDDVRTACRIRNSNLDAELEIYIEAARADMTASGIDADESKSLIKSAIIIYSKSQLATPDEAVKYRDVYDLMIKKASLCDEYRITDETILA